MVEKLCKALFSAFLVDTERGYEGGLQSHLKVVVTGVFANFRLPFKPTYL